MSESNTRTFFSWLRHSTILRLAAVMVVGLGASIPASGELIHDAARAGDLANVQALLKENPALVSSRETNGRTPLHEAAMKGHAEVALLLLSYHAEVDARDNDGATPLHAAAAAGHPDLATLLVAHGADVNARTSKGVTPLVYAVFNTYNPTPAVVEVLLAHHADPNLQDQHGRTPLHYAAYEGNLAAVKLLLANHADPDTKDEDGFTPWRMAVVAGHNDVAALLSPPAVPPHPSSLPLDSLSSKDREAIIYLADQLQKHPAMQGYILRTPGAKAEDEKWIVLQNSASRQVYETLQSPGVAAQLLGHTGNGPFQIKFAVAPGPYLELTPKGVEIFNSSLIDNGIQEGYRDDTLYLLNKDFEIKGRDQIIAAGQQLKASGSTPAPAKTSPADDYSSLLAQVALRVSREMPSTVPSDSFAPSAIRPWGPTGNHPDSTGHEIPPFLFLAVDLVKLPADGKPAAILVPGIQVVREFLEKGIDFGGHKADAFLILSNFPVFEHRENLFFDLIGNRKNPAVRIAAVLALRNDVFDQGRVCQYLSTLFKDPDHDVQYAAMLALASSDQLAYLKFQMDPFPTDDILARIGILMHAGVQAKMIFPMVRVLARSPYISNPKVLELRASLRNVTMSDPAQKTFYDECLRIIDAAK